MSNHYRGNIEINYKHIYENHLLLILKNKYLYGINYFVQYNIDLMDTR